MFDTGMRIKKDIINGGDADDEAEASIDLVFGRIVDHLQNIRKKINVNFNRFGI